MKLYFIYRICLIFCFIVWSSSVSFAAAPRLAQDTVQGLDVRVHYAQQAETLWGIVELSIAQQYYTYAPQDVHGASVNDGQAVRLQVLDTQAKPLPVYLPRGVEREDYYEKGKLVAAYTDKVYLFVPFDMAQQSMLHEQAIMGKLSLLLCSTQHCLPVRMPVEFRIPASMKGHIPLLQEQSYAALWEKVLSQGPVAEFAPSANLRESGESDDLGKLGAAAQASEHAQQSTNHTNSIAQQQELSGLAAGLARFEQSKAHPSSLSSDIPMGAPSSSPTESEFSSVAMPFADTSWQFSPIPHAQTLEVASLGKALFFGLLAGFILNLMPCVLPVLTLKMQSLLLNEEGEARIQAFRTHNLFFGAGILSQFLILGVILGSLGLMWGELFQNVYFVAGMLVVIFALALSLLGLFTLPILDVQGAPSTQKKHGASPGRQAFFMGMVATLLATPCSGPLLGGVLSWAFLQPLSIIVASIMAVGMGMALPYGLLAWQPQWVRFMPRPGAWMLILEKMVAFFLLGTALYIFSLLPSHAHLPMLTGLLGLAVMGWLWGALGNLQAPRWRRVLLRCLFVLSMGGVLFYGVQEPKQNVASGAVVWQEFTVASLTVALGKEPLLVEFTADWCPNCKYVEKTVLTAENLKAWQQTYGLRFIKVDITRDNAEGEALLHALGSRSIPFTAVFAPGEAAKKPVILRDIYTKESLDAALEQALKS